MGWTWFGSAAPSRSAAPGALALPDGLDQLRRRAEEDGRSAIPVTVFGADPNPRAIEGYRAQGVDRCLISLPDCPADALLAELDTVAKLVEEFG